MSKINKWWTAQAPPVQVVIVICVTAILLLAFWQVGPPAWEWAAKMFEQFTGG